MGLEQQKHSGNRSECGDMKNNLKLPSLGAFFYAVISLLSQCLLSGCKKTIDFLKVNCHKDSKTTLQERRNPLLITSYSVYNLTVVYYTKEVAE